MKKSSAINLVLVASLAAASCSSKQSEPENSRLYIRGDSASQYTQTAHHGGYYHFMPFGFYHPYSGYRHGGYESKAFSGKATNPAVARGGFGSSGVRVGS